MAVDKEGGREVPHEPVGCERDIRGAGQAREHDEELVAPLAADEVAGAHELLEPQRDRLEQRVTRGMAERVVDGLEAVQVEKHQRDVSAGARGIGRGLFEARLHHRAIGQARQGVMVRQELDVACARMALRHVADGRGDEATLVRVDLAHADAHREFTAVLRHGPQVATGVGVAALPVDFRHQGEARIARGQQDADRLPHQVCGGVAEHHFRTAIDQRDHPVGVGNDQTVGRGLQQRAEFSFLLLERVDIGLATAPRAIERGGEQDDDAGEQRCQRERAHCFGLPVR